MEISTRTQKIIAGGVLAAILVVLAVGAARNNSVDAPASPKDAKQASVADNQAQGSKDSEKKDSQYTYTAETGGTYTGMVRGAIASYAADKKIVLTPAQAIAAETDVVVAAGSPELVLDQQVTVSSEAIQSAVDKVASLTAEQQAAWQPYADLVAWS